jgi:hypothetical protein
VRDTRSIVANPRVAIAAVVLAVLVLVGVMAILPVGSSTEPSVTSAADEDAGSTGVTGPPARSGAEPVRVCGSDSLAGPANPPDGAVVVEPGADLQAATQEAVPGTTFWLAPGRHTLVPEQYAQVFPKAGNTYVGAPGAVLDGARTNQYAFGGDAEGVLLEHLTVTGFQAPNNEGVVNHDLANGWVVRQSTIVENSGAGVMLGDGAVVEGSCLKDNGQYGFSAYQPDGVTDVVLRDNEINGNNTDDWETQRPGCGCSGGGKFWATVGAEVTGNYVHDNRGVGLWADQNNSDFLFADNFIANNDSVGLMYETSYNAEIVDNVFVDNAWVAGPKNPAFPTGAVYISESGGDARAPGTRATLDIIGNTFVNNWSGVILWENADRFVGSPANTSTGFTTLVNPQATVKSCSDPSKIATEPLYSDCRWKTQNVRVHNNYLELDVTEIPDCSTAKGCGYMGVFSNYGTYPDWSPYQGMVVQKAITAEQGNTFASNTYVGPWAFMPLAQGSLLTWEEWRADPLNQDVGSTLTMEPEMAG